MKLETQDKNYSPHTIKSRSDRERRQEKERERNKKQRKSRFKHANIPFA